MASPPSRERRLEAYSVALVGAAPFATYSLAIIVVALVCGFWPGMMAVALSVVIGWFLG